MFGHESTFKKLKQTSRGTFIGVLLVLALGTLFVSFGIPSLMDARKLSKRSAVVDADVTEIREGRDSHGVAVYDIRYRFQVPPRTEWFTRVERFTGRTNLWSSVDNDAFLRAQQIGKAQVLYAVDDPWISRPVSGSNSLADSWVGIGVGVFLLFCGVSWLISRVTRVESTS